MPKDRISGQMTHWRVWDRGGRRQVLALHCMLAHSGIWSGLAQKLQGVILTAPDAIGHGQTEGWGGRGSYHRLATDVAVELAARLNADGPIDLIGHSFGATVALRLALERPELVRSLVLIEPVLFAAARGTEAFAGMAFLDHEMARLLPGQPEAAAAIFHGFWGTGDELAEMPAILRDYIVDRIGLVPLTNDVLIEDAAGLLIPGGLERIRCKVLLLEGGKSPPVIPLIQSVLAARLRLATRKVVAGAGHMLPLTHADELADAIQAHLGSS